MFLVVGVVWCGLFFRAFPCFFEGVPPLWGPLFELKRRRWVAMAAWRRFRDDFLWIWPPFGASQAPEALNLLPRELFWSLFGSLEISAKTTHGNHEKRGAFWEVGDTPEV